MKKILMFMVLSLTLAGAAFAQEKQNHDQHNDDNSGDKIKMMRSPIDSKTAFPIKRGMMTGKADKVSLAEALEMPDKYAGKMVSVEGVLVSSCSGIGCWMELAPAKDAKSIRITMKENAFFVPTNAASQKLKVKAEGMFNVQTWSKAEVDKMIKEDGAKFDNINADGTVTKVSFVASGVELWKAAK